MDFSAEIFGPPFLTVQKAYKMKLERGTTISWGPNISIIFVPGVQTL